MAGSSSKALTANPKDLLGTKKACLTAVSPIAIAEEAFAMMDGAEKYGPYNWRDKAVIARIYVDAALRHIMAWFEGEEYASDSLAHHLGHARSCLGILLDAQATGNLIDDRPLKNNGEFPKLLKELEERLAKRTAMRAPKPEIKPGPMCDNCGQKPADFIQDPKHIQPTFSDPGAQVPLHFCRACADRLNIDRNHYFLLTR